MEWDKLQRYASWMRQLDFGLGPTVPEEVLCMLSVNLQNGILCPGLQKLDWTIRPYTLPFYRLFLSPRLTILELTYSSSEDEVSDGVLSSLTSAILALGPLPLRSLSLRWYIPVEAEQRLESAVSSAILRYGPSLIALSLLTPLSGAAA